LLYRLSYAVQDENLDGKKSKTLVYLAMPKMKKQILKLFGDYYAEPTFDGTFVIKEKGILKSPHEYSEIDIVSPCSYAFTRAKDDKVDILFYDLSWLMGVEDVYEVIKFGDAPNAPSIIAVVHDDGIELMIDDGKPLMFINGFPHYTVLDERFIVVFDPERRGPYVRIYTLLGVLVAEGNLWEAQRKALRWKPQNKNKR
jgi:hypothetical protein